MANEVIRSFTAGDMLRSPRALLKNPDGTPVDLTGNGVLFRLVKISDGTIQINDSTAGVVILSSTNGDVRKDWTSTFEVPAGDYYAWFIRYVSTSTAALEHFPAGRAYKIRMLGAT